MKEAVRKYYGNNKIELEEQINMISGLRVLNIKGNHKKIFKELEYSLKRGHILKAITKN